jgi:hypothetical protein
MLILMGSGEDVFLMLGDFDNLDEFGVGSSPYALNPVQFTFLFGDF